MELSIKLLLTGPTETPIPLSPFQWELHSHLVSVFYDVARINKESLNEFMRMKQYVQHCLCALHVA